MKRAFAWVIALCMILALIPVRGFAATTGTCGDNATWTLSGSTLTISGTGEMADYIEENSPGIPSGPRSRPSWWRRASPPSATMPSATTITPWRRSCPRP